MKICVAGTRSAEPLPEEVREFERIWREIGGGVLIHGACCDEQGRLRGVDAWAERWAIRNEIDYFGMPARWKKEGGKKAGPKRQERQANICDCLVAFRGGVGTEETVKAFQRLQKLVYFTYERM